MALFRKLVDTAMYMECSLFGKSSMLSVDKGRRRERESQEGFTDPG
jgi:hypothetical protein